MCWKEKLLAWRAEKFDSRHSTEMIASMRLGDLFF